MKLDFNSVTLGPWIKRSDWQREIIGTPAIIGTAITDDSQAGAVIAELVTGWDGKKWLKLAVVKPSPSGMVKARGQVVIKHAGGAYEQSGVHAVDMENSTWWNLWECRELGDNGEAVKIMVRDGTIGIYLPDGRNDVQPWTVRTNQAFRLQVWFKADEYAMFSLNGGQPTGFNRQPTGLYSGPFLVHPAKAYGDKKLTHFTRDIWIK